jgi:hypothetical protein
MCGESSSSRVAARWLCRQGAILQAPPKLVEAVTEWAQGTFADRTYKLAQEKLKKDGEGVIGGVETVHLWLRAIKPWKRIPTGSTSAEVSTTFDFTKYLDGWRYKHLWDNLGVDEQNRLRKGPLRPFTVRNTFKAGSKAMGGWSRTQHELHFWVDPHVWMTKVIPTLVENHDKVLPRAARHELQHVTQNAIGALTGGSYGGLPKRRLRSPTPLQQQVQQQYEGPRSYFQSDIEYQTALADAVDTWETKVFPPLRRWLDQTDLDDRIQSKIIRWYLRVFVDEADPKQPRLPRGFRHPDKWPDHPEPHRFFKNIKVLPSVAGYDKWKSAVNAFYKEIGKTTRFGSIGY